MSKSTKDSTAIVIGAGFSGMASALILARHGYKVNLVEQAARPGMTLRGFTRKGVYFDSGVHYVGELSDKGILRTYLRYLGLGDLALADFDASAFETFRFADGSRFSLPIGYEAIIDALSSAFPHERAGIAGYMGEVLAAYDASPFHNFNGSLEGSGEKNPRWLVSLEDMLNQYVGDSRLRNILCAPGWLYGVPPREASFLLHARVAGSHFDSIRTFAGGGLGLVTACERRLNQEGVTQFYGSAVSRILMSPASAVSGVELENGERIGGDVVIHAGHPYYLSRMLPQNVLRPAFKRRLEGLKDCISAHLLFFAAENCPEALRKRNLIVHRDGEPFAAAFEPGRAPSKGPFYILSSPVPQMVRQPGDKTGQKRQYSDIVAVVLSDESEYTRFYGSCRGKRPQEYKDLKKERLAQFADALFTSCPDLSGLELLDGATPLTLHDWLYSPQAGVYGAAHSLSQFNPSPVTRIPNVYAAGQSIVAPGLMGAAISAFLTCGFIVGHKALLEEVALCKQDG